MVPFEGPNARLNITFGGQNGDYPDPVSFDATDADVKQIATEAIRTGYIPGIPADGNADIQDFVVDRFPATDELPPRLMLRPKTPFGEEDGIQAIIALQGMADIKESVEQARAGWRSMTEREKHITTDTYRMIFGSPE
jgi:hypothetical protein